MGVSSGEKDLVTVPEAVLTFYDCFIIEDCQEKRTYLVSNGISADATTEIRAMEKSNPGIYRGGETGRIGNRGKKGIRKQDGHGKFSP